MSSEISVCSISNNELRSKGQHKWIREMIFLFLAQEKSQVMKISTDASHFMSISDSNIRSLTSSTQTAILSVFKSCAGEWAGYEGVIPSADPCVVVWKVEHILLTVPELLSTLQITKKLSKSGFKSSILKGFNWRYLYILNWHEKETRQAYVCNGYFLSFDKATQPSVKLKLSRINNKFDHLRVGSRRIYTKSK